MERDVNSYFEGVLKNVDTILTNNFYKEPDKKNLNIVRDIVSDWYKAYTEKNTLIGIEPKKLEYIDLEITDFFDKYIVSESVKENYAERLLYDFGKLEHFWKDEMIGGKKNG